jgi:hypothetical protein
MTLKPFISKIELSRDCGEQFRIQQGLELIVIGLEM